jgi:hypothetical protein
MPEYDYIISLGGMCGPSWNVRNCFGVEEAYPFDWLITPGNSLIKLVKDKMSNMVLPQNLEIISDGQTVKCKHYEILHHHDFRRDAVTDKVSPDFIPQIGALQKKYMFLSDRFFSRCQEGRVLFVRMEGSYSNVNDWRPGETWGEELVATLEQKFPRLDFNLILLDGSERRQEGRLIHERLNPVGEPTGDWRGWPDAWKDMFSRLDVSVRHSDWRAVGVS